MVDINQLVLLVVSGHQSEDLMRQLSEEDFYFTEIDSFGGVLQDPTVCLLIGLNSSHMQPLLRLVRRCCKPRKQYIPAHLNVQPGLPAFSMIEAEIGGALVYAVDVERFEQV